MLAANVALDIFCLCWWFVVFVKRSQSFLQFLERNIDCICESLNYLRGVVDANQLRQMIGFRSTKRFGTDEDLVNYFFLKRFLYFVYFFLTVLTFCLTAQELKDRRHRFDELQKH